MRSLFKIAILFAALLAGSSLYAQGGFTTVSGAIVDPNSIPWAGGTITAQLITPGGTAPTLNGVSFTATNASGLLGPGGTFSFRLGDNGVILPSGTKWQFTVSISPGVLPPAGKGPQSFTVTTPINCSTNTPATCTANAMVITTALAPVPALSFASGGGGGTPCVTVAGSLQFNNSSAFGCAAMIFTPVSSAGCVLATAFAPCDNFQTSTNSNACIGGIITSDPANPTFPNSALLCTDLSASGGSAIGVTSTTSSLINGAALQVTASSKNISNLTVAGGFIIVTDDPTDAGTGQTFIATREILSLTRASGGISSMEGIRVETGNANTGGAIGAETTGTFYGIHIQDMLAKGATSTAALQIDAQTAGANAFAIKVDGGKSLFSGLLTTATPTTGAAGFNLPHGSAPTVPNNGDIWTTTLGLFVRINGATQGPFSAGFANPMTTVGDLIGGAAAGVPTRIPGGKTGQSLLFTNNALAAAASPGLADGNGGAAVTTTPYAIQCDSATALIDRVTVLRLQAGASVVNAPDHTLSGCGGNMAFTLIGDGAGTVTVNRGGADTFTIVDGGTNTDGAISFTLGNGQYATLNNGAGGIWEVRKTSGAGGSSALSALTAAIASNTIANGNNPQTWNWSLTTDAISAMGVGETLAATGGTLTNGLANQSIFAISTASNSTATPFSVTQGSITNTVATPLAQFKSTWNNAGLSGLGIVEDITNTAAAAGSLLMDLRITHASKWKADATGNTTQSGFAQLGASTCTVFGTAGGICVGEGTTPTNVAGAAYLYADGTSHEFLAATNGSNAQGMLVRRQPVPINQVGQTAAITTATLCSNTAGACNVVGQYHVHWNFWGSGTACSSVTAGSVGLQLTWTDENAVAHTAIAMPMWDQKSGSLGTAFNFNTALATEGASGDYTISTNGSIIQYATTYTACTTGTGTYNLRASVTRIQ